MKEKTSKPKKTNKKNNKQSDKEKSKVIQAIYKYKLLILLGLVLLGIIIFVIVAYVGTSTLGSKISFDENKTILNKNDFLELDLKKEKTDDNKQSYIAKADDYKLDINFTSKVRTKTGEKDKIETRDTYYFKLAAILDDSVKEKYSTIKARVLVQSEYSDVKSDISSQQSLITSSKTPSTTNLTVAYNLLMPYKPLLFVNINVPYLYIEIENEIINKHDGSKNKILKYYKVDLSKFDNVVINNLGAE